MGQVITNGLDIAKSVFQVHGGSILIDERLGGRHAGVVHEQADGHVVVQACDYRLEIARINEVGSEHVDAAAGLFAQAIGQGVQPRLIARGHHEIVATPRQPVGVDRADAGGCARH